MSLFFFWRAVCFSAIMQKFCAIALSYWLPVLAIRAKATMRNIFNSKKFIKTYGYPYNYQVCYYLFLLNTYTYPGCVAGVLDVVDNIIHHDGNLPVHITHHVQRGTFLFSNTLYCIYLYTIVFSNFVDPISEYGSGSAPFQIGKKGWNDVQIRTFLTCYYLLVFKKDFVNV